MDLPSIFFLSILFFFCFFQWSAEMHSLLVFGLQLLGKRIKKESKNIISGGLQKVSGCLRDADGMLVGLDRGLTVGG